MNKELKAKLTDIQYHVTQECGTEPPFTGEYHENKENYANQNMKHHENHENQEKTKSRKQKR